MDEYHLKEELIRLLFLWETHAVLAVPMQKNKVRGIKALIELVYALWGVKE